MNASHSGAPGAEQAYGGATPVPRACLAEQMFRKYLVTLSQDSERMAFMATIEPFFIWISMSKEHRITGA